MERRWPQLTAEQDRDAYLRGIRMWNEARFLEAHEAWEAAWRSADGEKRRFYQGLIQFAVGLFKLQQGRPSATAKLFELAREKWAGLPPTFLGLDCDGFLVKMRLATALSPDTSPSGQSSPGGSCPDCVRIELISWSLAETLDLASPHMSDEVGPPT